MMSGRFETWIGGRYVRLERPNMHFVEGGPPTGSTITCSRKALDREILERSLSFHHKCGHRR